MLFSFFLPEKPLHLAATVTPPMAMAKVEEWVCHLEQMEKAVDKRVREFNVA